jgi:hypothetical protein
MARTHSNILAAVVALAAQWYLAIREPIACLTTVTEGVAYRPLAGMRYR